MSGLVYCWSSDQARLDLSSISQILTLDLGRTPRIRELRYILSHYVHAKKGHEMAFVQTLATLYGFARLVIANGFPELGLETLQVFHNLRLRLVLYKEFAINEYEAAAWARIPGLEHVIAPEEMEQRVRLRELGMALGIIMAILKQYDDWRAEALQRSAEGGLEQSYESFTAEEKAQLKQIYADCWGMTRIVLDALTGRVDASMQIGPSEGASFVVTRNGKQSRKQSE